MCMYYCQIALISSSFTLSYNYQLLTLQRQNINLLALNILSCENSKNLRKASFGTLYFIGFVTVLLINL